MTKGYWVVHVSVSDPETYKHYVAANAVALAKFGGRFLTRGGPAETPEGQTRPRTVVIEFPSPEAARACYRSPEYAAALEIRRTASEADFVIVDGYDGMQPGEP